MRHLTVNCPSQACHRANHSAADPLRYRCRFLPFARHSRNRLGSGGSQHACRWCPSNLPPTHGLRTNPHPSSKRSRLGRNPARPQSVLFANRGVRSRSSRGLPSSRRRGCFRTPSPTWRSLRSACSPSEVSSPDGARAKRHSTFLGPLRSRPFHGCCAIRCALPGTKLNCPSQFRRMFSDRYCRQRRCRRWALLQPYLRVPPQAATRPRLRR